ncbi:hypothetical protein AVEN_177371-1 [Araneus ventricosus]|uniref:Uncharacterized protein n=1 Tax=Araneus ventricosus TaxID=182803 RepID=A0A4Y2L531_ARAVE|nr:hypothetical protein AVEN_177371-1 [Araneus ventricosus]
MDLMTIEKALEARFRDSYLTQFYRTELKTRRQKLGESLQVLAADVERLMSLAYAECPQNVRDSLAAQYFVDSIRHVDTQHATRLMDAKDLKSALSYSMKYGAAKTVSVPSRNVRSIEIEDGTGKEKGETFGKIIKNAGSITCWTCWKYNMLDMLEVQQKGTFTYMGSARRFRPTRKTNVWPSYGAKAAFFQ